MDAPQPPPSTPSLPPGWRPFMREADLARMCLAGGLNALIKANHTNTGLYNQAFFNLSVGLERMMKLIYLIDHALCHGGKFPSQKMMKERFRHDLAKLFDASEAIKERLVQEDESFRWRLPDPRLAEVIIEVLAEFASSTRYYNLDYLVGAKSSGPDPVEAWVTKVVDYLMADYPDRLRKKDAELADFGETALGKSTIVLQQKEDGRPINSVAESILHGRRGEWVQKQATFHCATIVRELLEVLWVLNRRAGAGHVLDLPQLFEYFTVYYSPDARLKGRRTFAG